MRVKAHRSVLQPLIVGKEGSGMLNLNLSDPLSPWGINNAIGV